MLNRYDATEFEHDGLTRRVFTRGEGPGIVVMTEVPGIYDSVIEFADRLVDEGYRVYLPDLIGEAGKPFSAGYALSSIARACIAK
jgi:dienelactone hydrolase